jgi:SAM-dependent methyltransferase
MMILAATRRRGAVTNAPVNLYDHAYGDYGSDAEAAVRRETYGEDLGQTSWLTAPEWLGFADRLRVTASSDVLDVGCGSGGPAVYLALERGCRLTGVDLNEHGVRNANALAKARARGSRPVPGR